MPTEENYQFTYEMQIYRTTELSWLYLEYTYLEYTYLP